MLAKVINALQKHPILVLMMFIIALVSGVITILLGWNQFYNDYLSKEIVIPIWFLGVLILIAAVTLILIFRPKQLTAKGWEYFEGKDFGTQVIVVDGRNFKRCTFDNTELVYEGRDMVAFTECKFIHPRFRWGGPAATTMDMLTAMYKDPTFRPIIEQSFENIRLGARPATNHPLKI